MSVQSSLRPNTLLSFSVPLLLFLTKAPASIQTKLLPQNLNKAQIIKYLAWSVALGLGAQLNSVLTSWARNNWLWGKGRGKAFGEDGWEKEVAVITGGSNGMGALIAKGLAAKGIKVAVLDIVEPNEEVENVHYFSCDITSPEAVNESAAAVRSFFGAPTILVNNAGVAYPRTILESKPREVQQLFNVNVLASIYTLQAFLPDMVKTKKGHIVTMASMASYVSLAGLVDYAATKSAILSVHEGLHQELKYRYDAPEIKTTSVHPIYVKTNLVSGFSTSLEKSKAIVLKPETVARAVIKQILSGQSGQLILPKHLALGCGIRGFPWWLQEVIRDGTKDDITNQ